MKTNNKNKTLIAPKKQVVLEHPTSSPITKTGAVNKHKGLDRLLLILINLVGYPVLCLVVGLLCKDYASAGVADWLIYVPLILIVIFWGIGALIQFIIFRSDKKRHRSFKHTMLSCSVVPICILAGFFLLLDTFMPKPLSGATSSTLFYEDLVVDARGSHELIVSKAQLFLEKNNLYLYETDANGEPVLGALGKPKPILDENGDKQYKHWFSDENQAIFKPIFASFDLAYQEFNGLAIEYALSESDLVGGITSGKIPLTVLMSIILRTTDPETDPNGSDVTLDLLEILSMNKDILVNAVKALLDSGFDFSNNYVDPITGREGSLALDNLLKNVIIHKEYNGIKWNVLQLLGDNPLSNIDPNKDIYQYDADTETTKRLGACLGYQDMAWLNSVNLLELICCLMDCRKYFYIFGVLIGLLTYASFIIKKKHLLITGDDLTVFPRSKKRMAKEDRKNYFFAKSANTTAELNLMYDMEEAPVKKEKFENPFKTEKTEKVKKEKPVKEDKKLGAKPKTSTHLTKAPKKEVDTFKKEDEVKESVVTEPINEVKAEEVAPTPFVEVPIVEEKPVETAPIAEPIMEEPVVEPEPIKVEEKPVEEPKKEEAPAPIIEEFKIEPVPVSAKKSDTPTFVPKGKKPAGKSTTKKLKF